MMTVRQLEWLLEELCVKLGFCLPPAAREEIRSNQPTSVTAFVDAVYRAEGLEPAHNQPLHRQVNALVSDAFRRAGIQVADA